MTKRLARLILLTVWATLIAGSVVAYFTTRTVLVEDLDARLVDKAASLPQLGGAVTGTLPDPSDRFIVKSADRTIARPRQQLEDEEKPTLVYKTFVSLADGRRMRSVTVKARIKTPTTAPAAVDGLSTTTAAAVSKSEPVTIIYTASAERLDAVLSQLVAALAIFDVVGGIGAWLLALRLSRAALRPLTGAADVIGTIDEAHLDRRISTRELPDELLPVASKLNDLLSRLERAFAQRRQFLADASHELRTPVAALMTTMEVTLRRPREAEEYKSTFETCLAETSNLRRLVQRLMEQARSEHFDHDEPAENVDVSELLSDCANAADALGLSNNIRVIRSFPSELRFRTQPNRLRSVVMNLLGNGVEYNRPGGTIELACHINGHGLDMTIRDTGKGIAPEDLPHLFEPFYRADKSRKRDPNHLGLGLFLVRSHVQALGGDCRVESTPEVGTTFRINIAQAPANGADKNDETLKPEPQHA